VRTAAHHVTGKADLARMKPSAILIITANEDDKLLAVAHWCEEQLPFKSLMGVKGEAR
jgi:hypothetical protein